jgi:cell division transport system permease protein
VRSFSFAYTPYYWLTVTSLAVLLFFGGLFVSSFWFSDRWEELFKRNIEFLVECEPGLEEAELIQIENKLSTIEGIRELRYVSPEAALKIMRDELGDMALPDTMDNPFQGSFKFKLEAEKVDTANVKAIQKEIESIEGVTTFYYPEDLYESVRSRIRSISLLMGAIGGILLLLILVMIHHQIRMYIMQHRYHIRTMTLVGATRNYIRKPFIMEVMKMSSFAILVAGIAYFSVLLWIGRMTGHSLFSSSIDMVILGMLFIIALGILMSFSAAWAAIQRYLESTDSRDFI